MVKWLVLLSSLVACGDNGGAAADAPASASLASATLVIHEDVAPSAAVNPIPDHVEVRVELDGLPCVALPDLAGTYGGVPIVAAGLGGMNASGTCIAPYFIVRPYEPSDLTTDEVEVHSGTSTIRATIPREILGERSVTAPSVLCGNRLAALAWSRPEDLSAGASTSVEFVERGQPDCTEGCVVHGRFTVAGSQVAPDRVTVQAPPDAQMYFSAGVPPSTQGVAIVTLAQLATTGAAQTCDGAAACTYDLAHRATVPTAYSAACP